MWIIFSALLIIFVLDIQGVSGADYHGLLSVEDYYTRDSVVAHDINLLTTRLRLDVTKLNDSGTLTFHFDGRERNSLGSKDYSSKINHDRIDTLNLEYLPAKSFYLAIGRLWPKEMPAGTVDGVNLVYQSETKGIGVFGGLKADPYTEGLNSDFTTAGAYLFYRKEETSAVLSYIFDWFERKTDRNYIFGQVSFIPLTMTTFYGMITADINQLTNKIDLTNAYAEFSFQPDSNKGITIGYNQFRSFKLYESMHFDIINTRQESYYIRGNYRFWNRYSLYGKYERQSRDYPMLTTGLSHANIYQMGFRNDNLINSGAVVDINATVEDSFSSTNHIYRLDINRLFGQIFQLSLNSSYMQSRYEINNYADIVTTYGAAGYLFLGRSWNLSLSYDERKARDYTTDSVMSRISYRF